MDLLEPEKMPSDTVVEDKEGAAVGGGDTTATKQDDVTVDVDLGLEDLDGDLEPKPKTQLINGGTGGERPSEDGQVKVVGCASSGEDIEFTGLNKEEVMESANDPFWVRLRWILFIMFWVGWFAMVLTAILIIVLAPRCPPRPSLKWYQTETIYQAYSKSFKDTNGDGVGDFGGIKEKIDYITTDIDAEAVYINAIYWTDSSSSNPDLAVLDQKEFDPQFNATEAQFKSWLRSLRKKGKKVLLDFIPNLTSKNHIWFKRSAQNDKFYKNFYIWAGNDENNPPNNLTNRDNLPAWTYDKTRKQWYYSWFSSDLPEVNLNHPMARSELKDIMKFWLSAGVSGFRILNVENLVENPKIGDANVDETKVQDLSATLDFLSELRSIADDYSDKPDRERLLFASVLYGDVNQTLAYYGTAGKKALHIVAPVMTDLTQSCDAACVEAWVKDYVAEKQNIWLGLQLGGDGIVRIGSRMVSDGGVNMAHALQFLLPGTPFNYYGDELAMKDNVGLTMPNQTRTPMQWNSEENAGFCAADVTPWLPVSPKYKLNSVEVNTAHFREHTVLQAVKKLIKLRSKESFQWGKTKVCVLGDLLLFTRKAERFPYYMVLINMGNHGTIAPFPDINCLDIEKKGKVMFHSNNKGVGVQLDLDDSVFLEPNDVIVLEFAADD